MQDSDRAAHAPSLPRGPSQAEPGIEGPASRPAPVADALFAIAIFSSAFLIFLVQPMVGKRIMPWFGGVPSVWMLCLAVYQTTLFLGYAYAHGLIRFVKPRLQPGLHALVVGAAFLALPVLPEAFPESLRSADPTRAVLVLLARSVALPFLALAATGPLVQAWFARAHPTRSPYFLYAVSNLGSLLALFVYPFGLEPRLALSATGRLWTVAFAATGVAVLACGVVMARSGTAEGDSADRARAVDPTARRGASRFGEDLLWLALSGSAVILLMGVTNRLCLDVASVPFLWIAPLTTYLATFILCFASERSPRRGLWAIVAVAAFAIVQTVGESQTSLVHQVVAWCALLFGACMTLHGELHRSRPAAGSLTRFYLFVSAGGALGGLFVGLVAPVVFDDHHELLVGLLLTAALFLVVGARDPASVLRWDGPRGRWALLAPLALAGAGILVARALEPDPLVLRKERSFFGVLTVRELPDRAGGKRTLANGTTLHGTQFRSMAGKRTPTAYYGRGTGIGLALVSRPEASESRLGVIGLGVGTLAAYGRAGDTMRFYEIDPAVIAIAGRGGDFSFLENSKAAIEVVPGDARLSLEDEQRRGEREGFDVLVLDAFSSDAIPVHLMTREAFRDYLDALAPGGWMAVHVTNRHFQLMDLVSRMAAELGAQSLQLSSGVAPRLQSAPADWVLVARDADVLSRLQTRIEERHRALKRLAGAIRMQRPSASQLDASPVWTDDYSDLFRVLR